MFSFKCECDAFFKTGAAETRQHSQLMSEWTSFFEWAERRGAGFLGYKKGESLSVLSQKLSLLHRLRTFSKVRGGGEESQRSKCLLCAWDFSSKIGCLEKKAQYGSSTSRRIGNYIGGEQFCSSLSLAFMCIWNTYEHEVTGFCKNRVSSSEVPRTCKNDFGDGTR